MIQQGNDLTLIWKITDPRGGDVNFSTFDTYEVLIESDYSNNVVKASTSAQGSELTFVFKAKDQEATGYYSLIFNATQNGKGFRVEAPRVIELEGARAAKAETGDENNILRVTSTLAVYLGGRDGMSPHIGANGNWWVFSDETKVYVDTGIKADYTGENDAAMAELKAATDAAVLINTSIQKDEVTRVANEDARITNENTRKSNEADRVKAEAARDAKYNQINTAEQERVKSEQDRTINEDVRIGNEDQRIANEADRVKRFAALESEVNNAASMAIAAGNTAIAQGNTAAVQGVKAESQGNTAAAQGNDAKAKGDAAKTHGDYAKTQGDYAKSEADKVAGDIANLKEGKLDKPTNEGEVDMVLTKTATGSEWKPSKGGAGSGFYGLGFKSGDNTVNLITKPINLGFDDFTLELWTRMEGCGSTPNQGMPFNQKNWAGEELLSFITEIGTNNIGTLTTSKGNFSIGKADKTSNLHHLIITRTGVTMTVIVNGRLIKVLTQTAMQEFTNFQLSIACSNYFSLGRVFNYAMSNDEAIGMLWNGGRVDDVVLDRGLLRSDLKEGKIYTDKDVVKGSVQCLISQNGEFINISNVTKNGSCWVKGATSYGAFDVEIVNKGVAINKDFLAIDNNGVKLIRVDIKPNESAKISIPSGFKNTLYIYPEIGMEFDIKIVNTGRSAILELLPSSIHSKGVYNTGSLGSSHDAVLSKPDQTTFIKEPQYKDKQMITDAPRFHPIAMGQECTDQVTGSIYKASVPPVGEEWSVKQWMQINR